MGRSEEIQPELSLEDVAKGWTRGKDRGKSKGTQRRAFARQGIRIARMGAAGGLGDTGWRVIWRRTQGPVQV